MSPLKGQKLTDTPKDTMLRTRVDRETVEKLDFVAKKLHISKSEVVRRGIDEQYSHETKK